LSENNKKLREPATRSNSQAPRSLKPNTSSARFWRRARAGARSFSMSVESNVVAVIDDDPMVRRGLAALLSASGYTVELYGSGEAFLRRAATCDAFCLIIDVQLGSGCGFDLARQLTLAGFTFPIIFVTANADKAVVRRAIEAGGVACLEKPLAAKLLMDLLIGSKGGRKAD